MLVCIRELGRNLFKVHTRNVHRDGNAEKLEGRGVTWELYTSIKVAVGQIRPEMEIEFSRDRLTRALPCIYRHYIAEADRP